VGLNYREDRLGAFDTIPAILQVWRPESADSPAVLVQQFETNDDAVVQEMGLIGVQHGPILYVITEEFNLNGTLACFQIHGDGHLSIFSEEWYGRLIWYQNLEDWGPTFVYFSARPWAETEGDWQKEVLYFITYSQDGFFTRRGVYWSDVFDQEEVTRMSNADDIRCIASYKLKMTKGWRSDIFTHPLYADEWPIPEEHLNIDGTKYFSSYSRWHEAPLANQGSVGE
jgi:hypothetical protein